MKGAKPGYQVVVDVLVLRALGIGDLLVSVPALRGLRRAYPRDRIVLAAPENLAQLVALTGAVDTLLPTPGLGALHWQGSIDLAVNLHGSGPESITDLVTRNPLLLATHQHTAFPELPGPPWRDDVHEVRRWCDLLAWHGIDSDPTSLGLAHPATQSPAPGAVVVHPGGKDPARRWPPDRFAEVARKWGNQVVVTGNDAERPLAEAVAAQADLAPDAVLAGKLGLAELAALVADARLVISNDTGVGHLATAYGTPSVVLFGPTHPSVWGPPADRRQHRPLWKPALSDHSVAEVLAAADAVDQR